MWCGFMIIKDLNLRLIIILHPYVTSSMNNEKKNSDYITITKYNSEFINENNKYISSLRENTFQKSIKLNLIQTLHFHN